MLGFLGYSICGDTQSANKTPVVVDDITKITLTNGVYDNFYMTQNTSIDNTSVIPTEWDFKTLMNANFEDNINAGNVDYIVDEIDSVKLKRRKVDSFDWVVLSEIDIDIAEDLQFTTKDNYCEDSQEYEYAIVPIMSDGTEGDYVTSSVYSEFNGVFIIDADTSLKIYSNVNYGTLTSNLEQGVHTTVGSKYPTIVYNSDIDYLSGSLSGTILPSDFETTRILDRKAFVKELKTIQTFLTNRKAKIIKDWNGNIWMVGISNTPTVTYDNSIGMGKGDISFEWVEQGDADTQADLYNNGFTEVLE